MCHTEPDQAAEREWDWDGDRYQRARPKTRDVDLSVPRAFDQKGGGGEARRSGLIIRGMFVGPVRACEHGVGERRLEGVSGAREWDTRMGHENARLG